MSDKIPSATVNLLREIASSIEDGKTKVVKIEFLAADEKLEVPRSNPIVQKFVLYMEQDA